MGERDRSRRGCTVGVADGASLSETATLGRAGEKGPCSGGRRDTRGVGQQPASMASEEGGGMADAGRFSQRLQRRPKDACNLQ